MADAQAALAKAALVAAEAALADIGDADREPGDDIKWAERRAMQALPIVRNALACRCDMRTRDRAQQALAEIERLTAALQYEQHRADRQGTHGDGCADWGPSHYECAIRERDELRDVLLRGGFVPCDIPACNCGSWHHRYGLPERMQEIKDALAEAGHELSNANGNLTLNALNALVSERDDLRQQLAEAELDAQRYRWLRNEANTARKCDPMVCIYPLDEQDLIDGDRLDVAIDAAMGLTRPADE